MFTLRTHAIICGSLFAAMIGIAILGNILQGAGMAPLSGVASYVAMTLFFGLFLAFGFSAIPVMVKLVVSAHPDAGNDGNAVVASVVKRQNTIIYALWGIMAAGTVLAVPAAIFGGMFGDAPQRWMNRAVAGRGLGTLSAAPGMTLDDMVKASTVKLELKYARTVVAGQGVFEFMVPNSAIRFPRARSYYITTRKDDPTRVLVVNISTSSEKASRAVVDSLDAALRAELARSGWLAGHEVYRTEQSQQLHGGAKEGERGRQWLKEGVVFVISRNRMDESKPGEAADAGEWIQYIEMWPSEQYPGFDRLVFEPYKES